MKLFKWIRTFFGLGISIVVSIASAQTAQTNLAVVVRHAPNLNGNGSIEGSMQQLLGEDVTINGGFVLTGDLLVPGTPALRLNGRPAVAGTIAGNGNASPGAYTALLNGNCSIRYLRTRTAPVSLPVVATPAQPGGTRNMTINSSGQSIGNPSTLRNLTLNGNVGQVTVPPGTYGTFTANGGSGFTLGIEGSTQPAVYNLQSLNLNGQSRLAISGPVILTVANGFAANGLLGTTNHSSWLQLRVAGGGFTLNGGCTMHGNVTTPAGTVIVNGNSCLIGSVWCDRLVVNGGGCIRACTPPNLPPVAYPQTLSLPEDTSLNITLTGCDPEGAPLSFHILEPPDHGTLSGTPPQLIYQPFTNFNGTDAFVFQVNDGRTNSVPATVTLTVRPVNDPPVADSQSLATDENTPLSVALTGSDVDGDSLSFDISTPPAHGCLNPQPSTLNRFIYTPASNYFGNDTFSFRANDGTTRSAPACVSILVKRVNHPPVASAQNVNTLEDKPVSITIEATDADGDALVYKIAEPPAHGSLNGAPPRMIYQPETHFSGADSFRFTASDGFADSAPATVSILVEPANKPPRLTAARTNRGKDFWLMFLPNMDFGGELPYIGCDLVVCAEVDTVGRVEYRAFDEPEEIRFQVAAGCATNLTVWNYPPRGFDPSDTILPNGIHVITDHPVTIHGLSYQPVSTDGFLALPTSMLDTNYLVLSYRNSFAWYDTNTLIGGTEFGIVAPEDETHVTITPAATAGSRPAGESFELVLQRGDTYRLINEEDMDADFTGTTIASDKPVAVFGGHRGTLIPAGYAAADHLVEQLPPLSEWGREFVTMPLAARSNGDTFRILAQTNGTRVAINGIVVATLDRGQFHETRLDVPAQILSSQPVLVAQYANSSEFDGNTGDPFMMLIPPCEQFGGDYLLATAPPIWNVWDHEYQNLFTHYLNLVVRTNGVGLISLDGATVSPACFQIITDTGYAGAQLPVETGAHHLSSTVPFGVCVYGWAEYASYAFMGGVFSETINSGTKLELEQPTPFSPVGGEKVVIARVTDGRGRPLVDIGVDFSVAGSNPAVGHYVTTRFGEAAFPYTGANPGLDIIVATLVDLRQSVVNTWIDPANNTPPVVSTSETQPQQFGLTAQLIGTVHDDGKPAGASLNTRWRLLDGPGDAQFENPGQLSTLAICTEPGIYLFELAADDSQFSSRSIVSVMVVRPFTVDLWGPEPGAWFASDSTFTFSAVANMVEGACTNIEFYDGDLKLAEGLSTDLTLEELPPGAHSITAVATEEHGFKARSLPLEFFVTVPPVIEAILPDHDLTLPYGASLATFRAHAWDPDGTITNFALYAGSLLLYQVDGDWIDYTGLVDTGNAYYGEYATHPVRFVATDDHGICTEIQGVNITLLPPQISCNILFPAENQVFQSGQRIPFLAAASVTPPARISGVMFYQREQGWWGPYWQYWSWPMDDTPPYTTTWLAPEPGDYEFSALVYCDAGTFEWATSRHIHVIPPLVPNISLETIPNGQTNALVGFPVLVAAQIAMTNIVQISGIEFFADGRSLGTLTNPPYLLPYVSTNPGPHVLTARATTECGASGDSPPLGIQSGFKLGIRWEGVRDGEWVPVGTNKTLGIRLVDPGSVFDHVEFVINDAVLRNPGFTFVDWTPAATGDYSLVARACDSFGNTYDGERITLHSAVLHTPQVRFVSPVSMARFPVGQPVPFEIEAVNPDSPVTNLSLFLYSQPEASSSTRALNYTWTNLPPGRHEFTAIATDDKGLTGQTKLRIIVDAPLSPELPPPQNLATRVLGCNAIQITWDTNSGIATGFVVVERAEGTNETWEIAGKAAVQRGSLTDHRLQPATVYRYRAYFKSADGARSVDSNIVVTRTRQYSQGSAVMDVAENLEDTGLFGLAAADNDTFPIQDDYRPRLVSYTPQQDDSAGIVGLDAFFTLGISDLNTILMAGSVSNYVWSPGGLSCALTDTNFFPFRMTRSGFPVGTRWTQAGLASLNVVTQFHAGYWADGFVDLTPDPQAIRLPMTFPPLSTLYDTFDTIADMNADGAAVGAATWVWVYSPDGLYSLRSSGPVRRATLWPANNRPPIHYGALQQLNGICESSFQAMNDGGDLVGVSSLYDPNLPNAQITHAIRSHVTLADSPGDKLTDLGTMGGLYSAALSINSAGIAVGYSTVLPEDDITNARAAYWLPTETWPRSLPGCGSNLFSYARAIDDQNQIVGEAVDTNGVQQAVLWKPNPAATNGLGYDLVNLNDLVSTIGWQLYSARSINRSGFVVGSGYHLTQVVLPDGSQQAAMAPRVFLLIPNSSLAVDFNRDGRIELDHKDDLPAWEPYQFWVNDDSDDSALGHLLGTSDLPGARSGLFEFDGRDPDWADNKVNGVADLVDWFPVYLNISNMLALLPPSQYEYRLVHSEGALNFLYTDLRPGEAGSYLTNARNSGFGPGFDQPVGTAAGVQQVTADGVALSAEFLNKIVSEDRGVLLFEARRPTFEPLRLEVRNRRRVVTSIELPLQISGVEAMYGWANVRPVAGQASERVTDLDPLNWPLFVNSDEAFVFLHGYNVNERQSRAWAAEMFKRLWWSGSRRLFFAFSWRGDETQVAGQTTIDYHINVRHAFECAGILANLITNVLSEQDVTVAAHSLGNMIVCSAIQDYGARPKRYYMVDAAVAMEAFDAGLANEPFMTHPDWSDYPERLCSSEWHQMFPEGDGRRGLAWRGRFQDVPHWTQLYNFYSSGEEVLENRHDDSDPWITDVLSMQFQLPVFRSPVNWLTGRFAWVLQETLKGRVTASGMAGLYSAGYSIGGLPAWLVLRFADVRAGSVMGSQYGGWGFNSFWDTAGAIVTIDGAPAPEMLYLPGGHRPPLDSWMLMAPDLEANPFFLPFSDARLTSSDGGEVALDKAVRSQVLAEAIPARTFAAGANKLVNRQEVEIGVASFNMNDRFQVLGWPADRLQSSRDRNRWKHSDIHDVPYLYTGMVFDKFVELEGGR
jgi:hypothetical protein